MPRAPSHDKCIIKKGEPVRWSQPEHAGSLMGIVECSVCGEMLRQMTNVLRKRLSCSQDHLWRVQMRDSQDPDGQKRLLLETTYLFKMFVLKMQ